MRTFGIPLIAAALVVSPALARDDKPITRRNPSAIDVATTPANDLNIRKDRIPDVLVAARERPYTLAGLESCRAIVQAVGELDETLGEDIDLPQDGKRSISATRVAQSVVGSFIPFRGILREVSGANASQRELIAAIQAGIARRSFLKGVGQMKGCGYPARSATMQAIAARNAEPSDEAPTSVAAPAK